MAGTSLRDLPPSLMRELGLVPTRAVAPATTPGGLILPPSFVPSANPTQFVPTSNFPTVVFTRQNVAVTAKTGIYGGPGWSVSEPGSIFIAGAVTGAAATLTVTLDGGTTWVQLNGGTNMSTNALSPPMSVVVAPGDRFDVSASADTTVVFLRVLFVPSLLQVGGAPMGAAASVDVTQFGGVAVPTPGAAYSGPVLPVGGNDGTNERPIATDIAGRVKIVVDQAQGAPGTAAPGQAVQIAGTDGVDLRVIATDASGHLTLQSVGLPWDAAGLAVTASTNVFGASYQPPSAGTMTVTIGNLSTGAASTAILSKTANSAPSGGSAGVRLFDLNNGVALTAGNVYTFQFSVTPNDNYNLQFGTGTTVDITAIFDPT